MAPKEKSDAVTFSFQEVACMIAAMNAGGVVLGVKHYGLMAKLDGERTISSFEHKFRAVKARGKELALDLNVESATPKAPKPTKKATAGTGKKRGKKDVDNGDDDEAIKTPSKKAKVKKEASEERSNSAVNETNGYNGSFFDDAMA